MRLILLGIAAAVAALSSVPALAQAPRGGWSAAGASSGGSFGRDNRVNVHRGQGSVSVLGEDRGRFGRGGFGGFGGDHRDGPRYDDHRADFGDVYLPYRDYRGDTLWRSDSFNDWWHERPDRAVPHWVRANSNCERLYWMGGGWRC
jgi:hypothetical protein